VDELFTDPEDDQPAVTVGMDVLSVESHEPILVRPKGKRPRKKEAAEKTGRKSAKITSEGDKAEVGELEEVRDVGLEAEEVKEQVGDEEGYRCMPHSHSGPPSLARIFTVQINRGMHQTPAHHCLSHTTGKYFLNRTSLSILRN
jgi:hypothetical protein